MLFFRFTACALGIVFLTAAVVSAQTAYTYKLSSRLQQKLDVSPNAYHDVYLLLSDRIDVVDLDNHFYEQRISIAERVKALIPALQQKANETQPEIIRLLKNSVQGRKGSVRSFWVTNVIFVEAKHDLIIELAKLDAIEFIDINARLVLDKPQVESRDYGGGRSAGGHEPGHDAIKAPVMWAMGYTGYGRVAMGLDTGVELDHPAINHSFRGHYIPLDQAWFIYGNTNNSPPVDCSTSSSHGTHTMGTMVGIDRDENDTVGVAFNAQWIGSPNLCGSGASIDKSIAGFQWALNPDGDISTISDMPDVINNSWYDPGEDDECNSLYQTTFNAVEAAGIAIVFSAGNEGSGDSTITAPKNINTTDVNVFCVGNVNGAPPYFIRSSSSRGPSICGGAGSLLIKPEVVAPGYNVRSSTYSSGYSYLTGTSMAAPHVSGAILLLKEAFPYLTGTELKRALYYTATDLGVSGEDNIYGNGLIDVPAAFNYLIGQGDLPQDYSFDAAVPLVFNIPRESCNKTIAPWVVLKNTGDSTITSMVVHYSYNSGSGNMLHWTGSLASGDTVHLPLPQQDLIPGNHSIEVKVSAPNGHIDARSINNRYVQEFAVLQSITSFDGYTCGRDNALLSVEPVPGTQVKWFTNSTGGINVGFGNNWATPTINANTTYYAEMVHTEKVGEPNISGGTGTYLGNTNRYLIFDCYHPFVLRSVKVFAENDGTRTIELRDSSGNILLSKDVYMLEGEQVIVLDFNVLPGMDLQLGVSGMADMYRNSSGLSYPYTINGVLSINRSNVGSPTSYYYYFYDWEVEYVNVCGRTATEAIINTSQIAAGFTAASINSNTFSFTETSIDAFSWMWDFGDGTMSTNKNPVHVFTQTGTFQVQLIASDANGCADTVSREVTVDAISGISSFAFKNLDMYPNPANDQITIKWESDKRLYIVIYNPLGERVWSGSEYGPSIDISIHDFLPAMYYLHIRDHNGNKIIKKFVKIN